MFFDSLKLLINHSDIIIDHVKKKKVKKKFIKIDHVKKKKIFIKFKIFHFHHQKQ